MARPDPVAVAGYTPADTIEGVRLLLEHGRQLGILHELADAVAATLHAAASINLRSWSPTELPPTSPPEAK